MIHICCTFNTTYIYIYIYIHTHTETDRQTERDRERETDAYIQKLLKNQIIKQGVKK